MFECVLNAVVLATDPLAARQTVAYRRWLNYRDGYQQYQGKIVPLFPLKMEPQGAVTDADLLGVLPYVDHPNDTIHFFASNYAVAIKLTVDAPTLAEATRYLDSMLWFNKAEGLTYHGHSAPVKRGELDAKIA